MRSEYAEASAGLGSTSSGMGLISSTDAACFQAHTTGCWICVGCGARMVAEEIARGELLGIRCKLVHAGRIQAQRVLIMPPWECCRGSSCEAQTHCPATKLSCCTTLQACPLISHSLGAMLAQLKSPHASQECRPGRQAWGLSGSTASGHREWLHFQLLCLLRDLGSICPFAAQLGQASQG